MGACQRSSPTSPHLIFQQGCHLLRLDLGVCPALPLRLLLAGLHRPGGGEQQRKDEREALHTVQLEVKRLEEQRRGVPSFHTGVVAGVPGLWVDA